MSALPNGEQALDAAQWRAVWARLCEPIQQSIGAESYAIGSTAYDFGYVFFYAARVPGQGSTTQRMAALTIVAARNLYERLTGQPFVD